jgi:hypothetical protein
LTKHTNTELAPPARELAKSNESALALVKSVLADIPTVEDDPTPRMMAAMVQATDAAQWEELFAAAHFKDNAGKQVRIHTFRQAPSQYEGSLGVFFICDVTWLATGENDVLTIGSDMAMAQLLNCWKRGDLPHDFEIVKKDKPTRAGFYPMRLKSLGRLVTGDPADVIEGSARAV